MKLSTLAFTGETPRATDNLLNATDASFAENTKLERGDLRPWRESSLEENLDESTVTTLNEYGSAFIVDEDDVDFVRSPIANDQYDRLYFTGKSEPRAYVNDIVLPGYYKLGVPAPGVQPDTELLTGGSGSNEDRRYAYCRVTKYGEEGPPSAASDLPGTAYKDDDEVGIFKIEAIPSGRQITTLRLYRTAEGTTADVTEFRFVKDFTIPSVSVFESGVSTANNGEYWSFDDGSDDIIYKCINNGTTADPDDPVNGVGGSGTDHWEYYVLTDDVDTDDLSLDVCPSETWLPPPTNLTGLIGLPNGIFVGFYGNEIYFSENYLPHAWPDTSLKSKYQVRAVKNFGNTIVVMTDSFPQYIVGDSPDTMQMIDISDFYPCASKRSAVSAKGGVLYASSYGLVLIDQDGAKLLTDDKLTKDDWDTIVPTNIHGHFYSEKYFGFNSSSGQSFVYDFSVNGFSRLSDVVYAGYVSIDTGNFYVVVRELETLLDPESDTIYKIKLWEGEEYNFKRYQWTSKKFVLGKRIRFSSARVLMDWSFYNEIVDAISDSEYLEDLNEDMIDNQELYGAIGDSAIGTHAIGGDALYELNTILFSPAVTFSLFVDGGATPKFTKEVHSDRPFKLPGKYKYRSVQYSLSGYLPVDSVEMATSMIELGQ